jgi:predicted amidohydrolase YtcJ
MTRQLLTGATVWTGASCSPRQTWVLIEDGRVAAVGDQSVVGDREQPPAADQTLDLSGHHVLPGFVDVHLHLTQAAWFPYGGDGSAWQGVADALRSIRVAADADPDAPWLLFWNVARFAWPDGRLPNAEELERAAPGRRILVSTLDMHRAAVSPAGLAELWRTGYRAVGPHRDEVTRDRRGRPTGEVWEEAYGILLQRALADLAAQRGEAGAEAVLRAEIDRCLAHGITHAHDPYVAPGSHEQMLALRAKSPMRLSWATGAPSGMLSKPPGPRHAPDGPYGDAGPEVKIFADGGDRCALRLPPRAVLDLLGGAVGETRRMRAIGPLRESLRRRLVLRDGHLHMPYLRYTDEELRDLVAGYAEADVRLRVHALGNLAGQQAARAFRTVGIQPGAATIDHLLFLDPVTADLVARSGAVASYQPGFIPRYAEMIKGTRIDRQLTTLGGRLLLRSGVPLVLSSDYPPGPLDPLHNLRCAVTRRLPDGGQLQPAQALTPTEAVRALSAAAAASLGAYRSGGIAQGEVADLAVCSGDPFEPDSRVVQTWVAGRRVWPGDGRAVRRLSSRAR